MTKKVGVIGGGIGGLCGAIRLAKQGYDVHLFERNKTLGGKMGHIQTEGYTFDTGPTLITMPFVIENFFQDVGVPMTDHIELIQIDPICRYFFGNKAPFDASSNFEQMQKNIQKMFPVDADNYTRFLNYAKRIYEQTESIFIQSPIHELRKILTWKNLTKILTLYQIDPFRTVHQSTKRFFKRPELVQLFDRYPTYNGSDPYRAPATLNVIPYVELGLGGSYIKGGLYQLVEALRTIASQLNVHVHTETHVERILHKNGRVNGIQTKGQKLDADLLLCNGDVVVTHNELLTDFPKTTQKLNQLEPSLSGITFFWGVENKNPQLAQHNILFSDDYKHEFKQIFYDKVPPTDPTIYISISSKLDKSHAPAGCENWFVLINMPYLESARTWDRPRISQVRKTLMAKLKQRGFDLEGKIKTEFILTPQDMATKYKSNCGSIYGISSNTINSAFKRPPNRSRNLRGLYFTGGSTHPGGGVPMCMLSSKIATDLIIEYEGK